MVIRFLVGLLFFFNFVNNIRSILEGSVYVFIYYWFFKNIFNIISYCKFCFGELKKIGSF